MLLLAPLSCSSKRQSNEQMIELSLLSEYKSNTSETYTETITPTDTQHTLVLMGWVFENNTVQAPSQVLTVPIHKAVFYIFYSSKRHEYNLHVNALHMYILNMYAMMRIH